ncbi:hypothetical protein [Dyadobacter aurulentus]|uniref:hypothetical protein n=1 Tax=Dyadobacter sp. UC 10 TaxID=2605428 RepID=UPI0011F35C00|nr:hypothetical protein [Dyadobacter sp. UC 10]KAA0992805.1 hypothetical protein FXO21_22820 [Dyadobacter sp. UC 10]
MKKVFTAFVFPLILGSCMNAEPDLPKPIVDPVWPELVSRDSITIGEHLGLKINSDAVSAYDNIQEMRKMGVEYANIVSNIATDLSQIDGRLSLYAYVFLDEQVGTDTGVQIGIKSGVVSSLHLNSGRYLDQWPLKKNASSSIRLGDTADVLYQKLNKIKGDKSYANKFERITLLTKDLSTAFDPMMAASPQWYFRYVPQPGIYEDVQIHLEQGKVKYFIVARYKG